NAGEPRIGAVAAAGHSIAVSQAAALPSPPPCSYQVSPQPASISAAGGNVLLSITTQNGCSWDVYENDLVSTLRPPTSGSGSGVIDVGVIANSGRPRNLEVVIRPANITAII